MFAVRLSLLILILGCSFAAYGGIYAPEPIVSTDLTSFGFGVVPPIMTLQASGYEQVCVIPTENVTCPDAAPDWSGFAPIQGDVSGTKKYSSPTLADLGIGSWADLAILFNANEPHNVEPVTLQDLRLALFDSSGTLQHEFALNAPIDFFDIAEGQGSAGFILRIDAAQQSAPFDSSWRIGMAAKIGCYSALGACDVAGNYGTGDGPESFTVVNLPGGSDEPVPEPLTMLLFGSGLVFLGVVGRSKGN